jgi:hypothetical protein
LGRSSAARLNDRTHVFRGEDAFHRVEADDEAQLGGGIVSLDDGRLVAEEGSPNERDGGVVVGKAWQDAPSDH